MSSNTQETDIFAELINTKDYDNKQGQFSIYKINLATIGKNYLKKASNYNQS